MRDRYDDTGADAEALMAVLMGEPVPEGDAAGARAARDMAVLAEQLKLIGGALADEETPARVPDEPPATAPDPDPDPDPEHAYAETPPLRPVRNRPARQARPNRRPRRSRRTVIALAASFVLLASVLGAAALVQYYVADPAAISAPENAGMKDESAGSAGEDTAAAKLAPDGLVACARLIVEGTVSGARRDGAGRFTVTLDADTYLKPDRGPGRERVVLPEDAAKEVTVGERMLVVVFRDSGEEPLYYLGDSVADGRRWVDEGLSGNRELACPGRG
ncbi:hypothetical protein [Streptomyces sp. NPDC058953]|uniref:hypothetical protein n=1 Tax=unclassified Streptomyces TaxID=2593676 RepID=UPI0036CE18C0